MIEDIYLIGLFICWLPASIVVFYLGFRSDKSIDDAGNLCIAILASGLGGMMAAAMWFFVIPILILYGACVKMFPYFKYLRDRN